MFCNLRKMPAKISADWDKPLKTSASRRTGFYRSNRPYLEANRPFFGPPDLINYAKSDFCDPTNTRLPHVADCQRRDLRCELRIRLLAHRGLQRDRRPTGNSHGRQREIRCRDAPP